MPVKVDKEEEIDHEKERVFWVWILMWLKNAVLKSIMEDNVWWWAKRRLDMMGRGALLRFCISPSASWIATPKYTA